MLLGATVAATVYVGEDRQEAARDRFERRALFTTEALKQRISPYTEVLYGAQGLFRASHSVTREEWREYVAQSGIRLRNPGIETAEFIRHVPKSRVRDFERRLRADRALRATGNHLELRIRPGGVRREYFIAQYVEPLAENKDRLGFDAGSDATEASAIERARRTGRPTASLPLTSPGTGERVGFRMFIPLYRSGVALSSVEQRRRAFIGLAGLGISPRRMLEGVPLPSGIEVQLYASPGFADRPLGPPRREVLVFSSGSESNAARPASDGRHRLAIIDVGGRRWIAAYTSRENLGAWFEQPAAIAVFAGGALMSLLLFAVTFLLSTSRERALGLARRMTSDLRQSEQRLSLVLDTMADGLVAADANGDFLIFNKSAESILGKGPRNVGTQNWQSHYGLFLSDGLTPAPEEALPLVRAIRGETVQRMELVIRNEQRPEGACVEVSATPLGTNGRPIGGVATFRDITERKRTEAELARRKEAERANQAKSEFLSRMSHELRTPLSAILGFAQILEMDELDPRQKESVGHILKGGRHLLELINEVLEISRIEAGNMAISLEPVPLDGAICEVLDLVKPLAAERGIRIERRFAEVRERHVEADRQRLKQVLLNLLSNAIKYNREGGLVAISLEERSSDRLRALVADTGKGIAEEEMKKLFTPFERLGAEQDTVEGTGLGLALSRRLVELMGGTLTVESEVGVGTTCSVELALAGGPSEGGPPSVPIRAASPNGAPRKAGTILHVEDNLSNYELVEQIFSGRPEIKLLAARQGNLGLELAQRHRPDLVLLDLHLPGMPGDEVLKRLKGDPGTRDIPVVVLSADATSRQIERLREAGAHAYLTKPLEVKEFIQVVDEALRDRVGA